MMMDGLIATDVWCFQRRIWCQAKESRGGETCSK